MINKVKDLEEKIQYFFKNKTLLVESLTHTSYSNENKVSSNERLEFLGDSVLSLIISTYLFEKLGDKKEGQLSRIRATIVCEKALRLASDKFALNKYISLGKGEESTGGRNRDSIIADCMEALIGAIYLDSNLECAKEFIFKFMDSIIQDAIKGNLFKDYKTQFQEIAQKNKGVKIKYIVSNEKGPDHNKEFEVMLYLDDKYISKGIGRSKKEAEQNAAKEALQLEK